MQVSIQALSPADCAAEAAASSFASLSSPPASGVVWAKTPAADSATHNGAAKAINLLCRGFIY